jgi:uracil-DNA glycosylase
MDAQLVKIAPEWREALTDEFQKPYFDLLATSLKKLKQSGSVIFPPGHLIFHAYNSTLPEDIKVVIIGQDPYHNPGEAMGLSFSVPKDIPIPPSLKNIYKALSQDVSFAIPDHGDLTAWTKEGVFLLNAVLTVEKNKPASHRNLGWQTFTDQTIRYLSDSKQCLVFMLWGNFAKNKKILIDASKHLILESAHPSPLAGNSFQACRHFSKANEYLSAHGKSVINWQL